MPWDMGGEKRGRVAEVFVGIGERDGDQGIYSFLVENRGIVEE